MMLTNKATKPFLAPPPPPPAHSTKKIKCHGGAASQPPNSPPRLKKKFNLIRDLDLLQPPAATSPSKQPQRDTRKYEKALADFLVLRAPASKQYLINSQT